PRVKMVASIALEHCLACFVDVVSVPSEAPKVKPPTPEPEKLPVPEPMKPGAQLPSPRLIGEATPAAPHLVPPSEPGPARFYERVRGLDLGDVVNDARRVLREARLPPAPGTTTGTDLPTPAAPSGKGGLIPALRAALSSPPSAPPFNGLVNGEAALEPALAG